MEKHYFAMLSRMKNIRRWGLMRNVREENLTEHSFETAYIAHALAVIYNKRFGGNVDVNFAVTLALYHDTSEILTGDLPTPIKYYNPEIKTAYKEIEAVAEDKLLAMLPEDLRGEYEKVYKCDDKELLLIVKAADKISALIKCIEETDMGNREFRDARKSTEKAVRDLNFPAADAFLDEFAKSYGMSLDNQK